MCKFWFHNKKCRVSINYQRISLRHYLSRKCSKIMKFESISHSERNIWNGPIVATAISREKRKPMLEGNGCLTSSDNLYAPCISQCTECIIPKPLWLFVWLNTKRVLPQLRFQNNAMWAPRRGEWKLTLQGRATGERVYFIVASKNICLRKKCNWIRDRNDCYMIILGIYKVLDLWQFILSGCIIKRASIYKILYDVIILCLWLLDKFKMSSFWIWRQIL